MKLGELRGERAIEVIADLIAPITNIAEDQENLQLFRAKKQEGETARDMVVRDFKVKLPNLLKTHKKDIIDIVCAVNDTKPDELSILDISRYMIELFKDQEFLSLFMYAVSKEDRTPPSAS